MLDAVPCNVATAQELDSKIREILALDMVQRGDEISGTLNVYYTDESVRGRACNAPSQPRAVSCSWIVFWFIRKPRPANGAALSPIALKSATTESAPVQLPALMSFRAC